MLARGDRRRRRADRRAVFDDLVAGGDRAPRELVPERQVGRQSRRPRPRRRIASPARMRAVHHEHVVARRRAGGAAGRFLRRASASSAIGRRPSPRPSRSSRATNDRRRRPCGTYFAFRCRGLRSNCGGLAYSAQSWHCIRGAGPKGQRSRPTSRGKTVHNQGGIPMSRLRSTVKGAMLALGLGARRLRRRMPRTAEGRRRPDDADLAVLDLLQQVHRRRSEGAGHRPARAVQLRVRHRQADHRRAERDHSRRQGHHLLALRHRRPPAPC